MTGLVVTTGPSSLRSASIAAGATGLSDAIDLGDGHLSRIDIPASWIAANLTFAVSTSLDGTYLPLYDSTGVEYTVTAAASRAVLLKMVDFLGVRYLKIRSGTVATPVNQTGAPSLLLSMVP